MLKFSTRIIILGLILSGLFIVFKNLNRTEISTELNTPNQENKRQGWSNWQRWDSFPHERIQMGMSNMDYGGMMDTEYTCFGSVGSENELKKSLTYWYRISETKETIGEETFVKLEVGCWLDNQFKATMTINGIVK